MPLDIETFPVPLALITGAGRVKECNAAFRELAAARSTPLDLKALFGPEIEALLVSAATARSIEATLTLGAEAESVSRSRFRVTLMALPDGETWTVHLVDVSQETLFHQARARDIEVLREIGNSLAECGDMDAITNRVCEHVARLMRTREFYVALHDRDSGIISFPRYLRHGIWRDRTARTFSNGLTEHVLVTGMPLLLSGDVVAKARAMGIEAKGPPSRCWLGVPMIVNGEALGMIATQSDEEDRYDRRDLEILEVIAGQAAAAIKHARLLEEARAAYQDLSEAQARLLEVERVRGITEAVGAMNHEINNPLAAIVGNAQLLMRRNGDSSQEAIAGKIESILDAARRIQEVTTKMATLIQATTMPYPGEAPILDIRRSVAAGDSCALFPVPPAFRKSA